LFSKESVRFYLEMNDLGKRSLWVYPENPVDGYEPQFDGTFLIEQTKALNVKYLLIFEQGNITFYESKWRTTDIIKMVEDTGSFCGDRGWKFSPAHIYNAGFVKSLKRE
jgi:hypothetical protein